VISQRRWTLPGTYCGTVDEGLTDDATDLRLRAGDPVVTSRTFYATEKPSILFVEFRLDFPCEDASQAGRVDAVLTIAGDGQYQTNKAEVPWP
jgi:hypothetical protein